MKILLLSIVFISTLLSQTTLCYKENTTISKINKSILLDGGECQGRLSATAMEKHGWKIEYSQVSKKKSVYNHLFIFKKETQAEKQSKVAITQQPQTKTKFKTKRAIFNLATKEILINDVNRNKATINTGNLKIGQSGIIVHKYNKDSIIIASAIVQSSSASSSTLMLYKPNTLVQSAIPTSSLQPANGDTFVLNHMYNSSLLIVPNYETYQEIQSLYPTQNFLNSDIFAAYLKIEALPVPKQKDVKEFCKANDIGTIFIAVNNQLYILDTYSFKTLHTNKLSMNDSKIQTPFFTKVTDIEKDFWDFGESEIRDYNSYFSALIGNTTYQPTEINNEEDNDKSIFSEMLDFLPW